MLKKSIIKNGLRLLAAIDRLGVQNNTLKTGRKTGPNRGYRPRQESFDRTWQKSNPKDIVARTRMQGADNPQVVTNRRRKINHVVRTGLEPDFQFVDAAGNRDTEKNERFRKRYNRWSKKSDATGILSFRMQQRVARNDLFVSGEFFTKKSYDFSNKNINPLRIELLERDHLDTSKNSTVAGDTIIRRGIEYNSKGKPVAYWLFPFHPSDGDLLSVTQESQRIPADWVIHTFVPERISQRSGVPEASCVWETAHNLEGMEEYSLLQARAGAMEGGNLEGGMPGDAPYQLGTGLGNQPAQSCAQNPVSLGENGELTGEAEVEIGGLMYRIIPNGMKWNPPESKTPNANLSQFSDHSARRIASPVGLSYGMSTGDFQKSSFAAEMAALEHTRVDFECDQFEFIETWLNQVMGWFLEAEYFFNLATGRDDLAGYMDDPDYYLEQVGWQYNGEQTLNPYQQANANRLQIDLGMLTHRQSAASIGNNFDENMDSQMDELEKLIARDRKKLELMRVGEQIKKIKDGKNEE